MQQEQEAAEFEKLQMKFGFSDKVSTGHQQLHRPGIESMLCVRRGLCCLPAQLPTSP